MKNLFVLLLLFSLFVGCKKEPKAVPVVGKTFVVKELLEDQSLSEFERKSLESLVEKGTERVTEVYLQRMKNMETAKAERERPLVNIPIDDALARPDLPPGARAEIEKLKMIGAPVIPERTIERLMKKHDTVTIRTRHADYRNPATAAPPTLAKSGTKNGRDLEYDSSMLLQGYDYILGRTDYWQLPIDHFKSKTLSKVSATAKKKADLFVQQVFESMPFMNDVKHWEDLRVEGERLDRAEYGLKLDPMFMLAQAIPNSRLGHNEKATEFLDIALTKFESSNYPARIVVKANQLYNINKPPSQDREKNAKNAARYFVAINYWIENDLRAEPKFHRYVYEDINAFISFAIGGGDEALLETFNRAFASQTNVSPWIRTMVRGSYFKKMGWHYRGSGFANTVSTDGWEKFGEYEKKAGGFFKQAHKINPFYPEAATELIEVSRTGHTNEAEDHWFEEAVKADSMFWGAYHSRMFGLSPQWGGSGKQMIDFALKHSLAAEKDSPIPYLALRCFHLVDQWTLEEREAVFNQAKFQKQMIASLDKLIANKKGPIIGGIINPVNYPLTAKAVLATRFGDMKTAHQAFEKLKDRYVIPAARKCGVETVSFESFRAPAFALTSEFQNEAQELLELMGDTYEQRMDNSRKILELASNVLRENTDPTGSLFFKQIEQQVRLERAYKYDSEVKLTFDRAMLNWNADDISQLKFESKDSVAADAREPSGNFHMRSQIRMDGPKEIRFDIEFPDQNQTGATNVNDLAPTVVVGRGLDDEGNQRIFGIGLHRLYERRAWHRKPYQCGKLYFQLADIPV